MKSIYFAALWIFLFIPLTDCNSTKQKSKELTEPSKVEMPKVIAEDTFEPDLEKEFVAPVFSEEAQVILDYLIGAEKWAYYSNQNGFESGVSIRVTKNEKGLYRIKGEAFPEGSYIAEIIVYDEGGYSLNISREEGDYDICYEFTIVSELKFEAVAYFECARGGEKEVYIKDGLQANTEPAEVLIEKVLKFIDIWAIEGESEFLLIMVDDMDQEFRFPAIDIEGFKSWDNPYFEDDPDGMIHSYRLKEQVKLNSYKVSFVRVEMDLYADGENSTQNIIKVIEQVD